jgi:DNA-binding transcriptional regulator YiaG
MPTMAKRKPKPTAAAPSYTPEKIQALRKRLGLTQTEAAEKVGVTQRAWLSWETGAVIPSRQSVILIRQLDQGKL